MVLLLRMPSLTHEEHQLRSRRRLVEVARRRSSSPVGTILASLLATMASCEQNCVVYCAARAGCDEFNYGGCFTNCVEIQIDVYRTWRALLPIMSTIVRAPTGRTTRIKRRAERRDDPESRAASSDEVRPFDPNVTCLHARSMLNRGFGMCHVDTSRDEMLGADHVGHQAAALRSTKVTDRIMSMGRCGTNSDTMSQNA